MTKKIVKKRLTVSIMGLFIIVSMLFYPIFATNVADKVEENKEVVEEELELTESDAIEEKEEVIPPTNEQEIEKTDPVATVMQPRATVGDTFSVNIKNNGVQNLPCTFKILTEANDVNPGTVQVGDGGNAAISPETTGTIEIPNEVTHNDKIYKVTAIGYIAFSYCTGLTSTGLDNNSSVITLGHMAYFSALRLTSTGLENNNSITTIGDKAFYGTGLLSTGLESNNTVTTIGSEVFWGCNFTSTGLERNTTVKKVGYATFENCPNLEDIIFEISTLPEFGQNVFAWTGVNIYYLSETTNPEVLNNSGATSLTKMRITNIDINSKPTKTTYIEEQEFDPTGLVLDVTYDTLGTKPRNYSDSNFASYFNFDKTEVHYGDTNINIMYLDKSITIPIKVDRKTLTDITVKKAPTKMEYIEGQEFDPSGLIISKNYDNGKSEDIVYTTSTKENFSFDKKTLSLADRDIVIKYYGKSVSLFIQVNAKEITNINVKTVPIKIKYQVGEIFNLAGLELEVTYNNGNKEEIVYDENTKDLFTYTQNKLTIEDKKVIIEYKEKKIEIVILVYEIPKIHVPEPEETVTFQKYNNTKKETVDTSDMIESNQYILLLEMSLLIIGYIWSKRKV